MRPWPVLIALLAAGAMAQAQTPPAAPTAPADAAGLRGPAGDAGQPAAPPPVVPGLGPAPYALPPMTPVPFAPPMGPGQVLNQCISRCDRDYYFCMAGEAPDACGGDWAQCRSTCTITARRSPAPLL